LAAAARRWADRTNGRIALAADTGHRIATVTAVTAGAASDGNALVTVTYHGSPTTVEGYVPSYTPAVSDRVIVAVADSQWIILGAIVGQP
jgi:hypothetical protein